jgi:DNA-binding transcriptional ArsR family regulator
VSLATVVSPGCAVNDLTEEQLTATAALFSALAHPGRLRMLFALMRDSPLSAGELAERAGLEQTAASHQLRHLRRARLIDARREGRLVLYTLTDTHVSHIIHDAVVHAQEEHP